LLSDWEIGGLGESIEGLAIDDWSGRRRAVLWRDVRGAAAGCTGARARAVTNDELEYLTPSTEYRVPNAEHRMPITEYRIPNTEYRIPNTEYRTPIA
jgi:hypothetical protein